MDQQVKNYNAGHLYTLRKQKEHKTRFDRDNYHQSVANTHHQFAADFAKQRELNEQRIRHLEEVEQRLVGNLQSTLMSKNMAINELNQKSRSLKKVMQPRMAYKYKTGRNNSNSATKQDFMNLNNLNSSKEFLMLEQ